MAIQPDSLRDEALALPQDARAELAAELLDTDTAEPNGANTAWANEIEERARQTIAGTTTSQNWDAVRQRLATNLPE